MEPVSPVPARPTVDLTGLPPERLLAHVQELGGRPVHAWTLLRALHREGLPDPAQVVPHLGKRLLAQLARTSHVARPRLGGGLASADGTTRYLLELRDGHRIEAVDIPEDHRTTLCISSQVGCAFGCSFCRTGTLGLERNLDPGEIAGQVALLRAHIEQAGREVTNVVFMGMGEPLANYPAVRDALQILMHDRGGGFPPKRLTVSTSGLPAGIRRLGEDFGGRISLAVSLTGTTDAQRDRLMPVNRRFSLDELLAACRAYPLAPGRTITFETVLLGDETDRPADADRLAALLGDLPVKVNLIPFNPFPGCGHRPPTPESIEAYFRRLNAAGVRTMIRQPRGRDVGAACGMLAASAPGLSSPPPAPRLARAPGPSPDGDGGPSSGTTG